MGSLGRRGERPSERKAIRIAAVALGAAVLACLVLVGRSPQEPETVFAAAVGSYPSLDIAYPREGTLFPPEIAAPTLVWGERSGPPRNGVVRVTFGSGAPPLYLTASAGPWTLSEQAWETIKQRALGQTALLEVLSVKHGFSVLGLHLTDAQVLSRGQVTIGISQDRLKAPLFYREVNLPFVEAVKDPSHITWRFGTVAATEPPPVVLEKLPVCGNCHSFSADGKTLALDVDYANDKGSYAIAPVSPEIVLDKTKIITWSDYERSDEEPTFGLLSQVSPDGRYVVSTVKDRSVFVPKPDLEFSQLFFPIKGILVVYSRETGEFHALPGADDPQYVQSNPSWSPDGKYIVFTRARAHHLDKPGKKVLLTAEECKEFLKPDSQFRFDLYRVPFNEGRGGVAEPLRGASRNGKSNYFAKYSPDGRWIVFCQARSFSLLQPDSRLYIIPAAGGRPREMRCNTRRMNSWHTFSPDGRWLVFTSKARSAYTQLFLTHIDEQGNDSPAVVLDRLTAAGRAANIPEFVNVEPGFIHAIRERFIDDTSYARSGTELLRQGDSEKAMRALQKSLALNPQNAVAHINAGVILLRRGQLDAAIGHLKQATSAEPKRAAEAHVNLGTAFEKKGNLGQAIYHYSEAAKLAPTKAEIQHRLGKALTTHGRLDGAIAALRAAAELSPASGSIHQDLALALQRKGLSDQALQHARQAVSLAPTESRVHNTLGVLLIGRGDLKAAIAALEKAVALDSKNAKAQSNLGVAYHRAGQRGKAMEHYRSALALDPNQREAKHNLEALLRRQGSPSSSTSRSVQSLRAR